MVASIVSMTDHLIVLKGMYLLGEVCMNLLVDMYIWYHTHSDLPPESNMTEGSQ